MVLAAVCTVPARAAEAPARRLRVAVVADAAPFSYQAPDGSWKGLAVELWHLVADQLNRQYEFIGVNRGQLIDQVAAGDVDFGIGPITMTAERLRRVGFSVPFYVTGLGIAVPRERRFARILVDNVMSVTFIKIFSSLLALLILVGILFWVFERRKNPQEFGGLHVHGFGSGLWLAVVTMTTVGYGDKSPKTFGGRVTAVIWMFISLLLISTFTGTVASILTADRFAPSIRSTDDLYSARVVTVDGSGAATLLESEHINARRVPTLDEALNMVINGSAAAVALDRAWLKYKLKNEPSWPVTLLPGAFLPELYAFAMPHNSPYTKQVNETVLAIIESPEWQTLELGYVGSRD